MFRTRVNLIADKLGKLGYQSAMRRRRLHHAPAAAQLIAGRSRITAEMAVKLEKAIGGTADTWLRIKWSAISAQVRNARLIKVKRFAPRLKIVPTCHPRRKLKPSAPNSWHVAHSELAIRVFCRRLFTGPRLLMHEKQL